MGGGGIIVIIFCFCFLIGFTVYDSLVYTCSDTLFGDVKLSVNQV